MRRTYSYAEAVKILGGKDHPIVAAMDKLLGGALLAGSLGLWQVLELFDAKPDFTRLFSELATKVSETRRGLSRYSRTQRLQAAHAVVVVTAYFEAFRELRLPFAFTNQDWAMAEAFEPFDMELPLPSAGRPYEENLAAIRDFYRERSEEMLEVAEGVAAWDHLNDTQIDRVVEDVRGLLPRAIERYEEMFRQLAVDFPEVAFWCSVENHRATRAGLARLEEVLRDVAVDPAPDVRLAELTAGYGLALRRPLVQAAGLRVPTLGEAYVDPRFQVQMGFQVQTGTATVPSTADAWRSVVPRADLYGYLVGHLTSVEAWDAPLLVLGDPGSGKSVLTEMLAARLSTSGCPVVRVELRDVPAEADLVRQVEHGLRRLLDEDVSWADFSRATRGSVPVVILDGLDELMQATGVSQTGYLTAIGRVQEELLAKNRPAAFVVTSRLSVCAGMDLPPGSPVVRLLPFSDDQVRLWLDVWNAANPPLPAEVALSYPELACQPLLLLMLALYDAVDGSLQRDHLALSQGQLYERLLERFARREVAKSAVARTEDDLAQDVEFELDRLSVVALGMFNRGVQWVNEQQVTADLAALLEVESPDRARGTRTPLSSGELTLGRFFFVQKSEAVRGDDTRLATYEFLHATFGEYLVARFVWRALLELHREDVAKSRRKSTVDDTELYSLLSFTVLTTSKPVLDFLGEFAWTSDRDGLFDLVVRLLAVRDERRLSRGTYEPLPWTDSMRDAKYAVNLVLLALVLRETVYAPDLRMSLDDWQRAALFWKSRLPANGWASVVRWLWVERDDERAFVVRLNTMLHRAHDEWHLLSEPYVTLDEVSLTLREALSPLTSKYDVVTSAALVELVAAPVEEWLPALERLHFSGFGDLDVAREVCARIGQGGDDLAILRIFGSYGRLTEPWALEAWLRLHERGFEFPQERDYPDLAELLVRPAVHDGLRDRPDLVKRATLAAAELGLEWPPSERRPSRPGPAR